MTLKYIYSCHKHLDYRYISMEQERMYVRITFEYSI